MAKGDEDDADSQGSEDRNIRNRGHRHEEDRNRGSNHRRSHRRPSDGMIDDGKYEDRGGGDERVKELTKEEERLYAKAKAYVKREEERERSSRREEKGGSDGGRHTGERGDRHGHRSGGRGRRKGSDGDDHSSSGGRRDRDDDSARNEKKTRKKRERDKNHGEKRHRRSRSRDRDDGHRRKSRRSHRHRGESRDGKDDSRGGSHRHRRDDDGKEKKRDGRGRGKDGGGGDDRSERTKKRRRGEEDRDAPGAGTAETRDRGPQPVVPLGNPPSRPPERPLDAETDYFSHHSHLRLYLYRTDGTYFEDLSSSEARVAFKRFVKDYNEGRLPGAYYDADGLPAEALEECQRTKHQWKFRTNVQEVRSLEVVRAGVKKQTEYRTVGGDDATSASQVGLATGKMHPKIDEERRSASRGLTGPARDPATLQKEKEQKQRQALDAFGLSHMVKLGKKIAIAPRQD